MTNASPPMKKPTLCHPQEGEEEQQGEENEGEGEGEGEDHDHGPCKILQLPDHITVEIFCKIPTKTLVHCKCVCKSWRRALSDPQFTKYLFSRAPTCLLLSGISPGIRKIEGHFLVDLSKADTPDGAALKLPNDPNFDPSDSHIVGSCNGFLCLYDGRPNGRRFYMSNPITGESLPLPTPPAEISRYCGFGFSPISDVYKLVVFVPKNIEIEPVSYGGEVMVLTSGSGIWRQIGGCDYSIVFPSYGVSFNGFLHWVGQSVDCCRLICAFHIDTESFQHLSLPPSCALGRSVHHFRLEVLRGSLSLIVPARRGISVWVMKDYGVNGSWIKEHEIAVAKLNYPTQVLPYSEDGLVFLLRYFGLHAYDLETRGLLRIEVDGLPEMVDFPRVHIPSFVSLKDVMSG